MELISLSTADWQAIWLTIKLAGLVTILLLIISIPLAWWLARKKSLFKGVIGAITTLPLVLPPTVIGFYFLLAMGANGLIGEVTRWLGWGTLAFSFWGLVIASVAYSLPFVLQPIKTSFESISERPLEVAAIAGANPLDVFLTVALPLARPGIITGSILGFVHTIGEFGVVLMIGGCIPAETKVVSIQIYEHVESLNYSAAHQLSVIMVIFSFVVLVWLQSRQNNKRLGLF